MPAKAAQSIHCPVCKTVVSSKHLRLHLTLSQNPKCWDLLQQLDEDLSSDEEPTERPAKATPSRNATRTTYDEPWFGIDATGDHFGDYDTDMGEFDDPNKIDVDQDVPVSVVAIS